MASINEKFMLSLGEGNFNRNHSCVQSSEYCSLNYVVLMLFLKNSKSYKVYASEGGNTDSPFQGQRNHSRL